MKTRLLLLTIAPLLITSNCWTAAAEESVNPLQAALAAATAQSDSLRQAIAAVNALIAESDDAAAENKRWLRDLEAKVVSITAQLSDIGTNLEFSTSAGRVEQYHEGYGK